jgi:UDP-N-acetyl-D-mannosaminuronate dehydrogenase
VTQHLESYSSAFDQGGSKAVRTHNKVVVVGLGEVGKPLFQLASQHHDAIGIDVSPVAPVGQVDVLHICYPFEIPDFVGETARYIAVFNPELTIVNSTVAVGTTRAIALRTGAKIVNSPVRGKHARMLDDLRFYTKFVGAMDHIAGEQAAKHFQSLGLKTCVVSSPETTELAKLTETTYFGLLIAWAQEIERYCDQSGQNYDEVVSFYEEIHYLPASKYFPGIIGGHCVMPNINILQGCGPSVILKAILASNSMKIDREAQCNESLAATVPACVSV